MVLTIAVWYRELPLLCTSPVLQPSLEPLASISHSIVSVFFFIFFFHIAFSYLSMRLLASSFSYYGYIDFFFYC